MFNNIYFIIAIAVNFILLIVFYVALFKIMRYTREAAENTSKIRQFVADIKNNFTDKVKL